VTASTGTRNPYAWIATIAVLDRPTDEDGPKRQLSSQAGPAAWSLEGAPTLLYSMPPRMVNGRGHHGAARVGIMTGCIRIGDLLVAEGTISPLDLKQAHPGLLERFMERKPLACGIDVRSHQEPKLIPNGIEFVSWKLTGLTLHDDDDDVSWDELVFVRNDLEAWKTLTELVKGRTE
jgi:hypothetical protein